MWRPLTASLREQMHAADSDLRSEEKGHNHRVDLRIPGNVNKGRSEANWRVLGASRQRLIPKRSSVAICNDALERFSHGDDVVLFRALQIPRKNKLLNQFR